MITKTQEKFRIFIIFTIYTKLDIYLTKLILNILFFRQITLKRMKAEYNGIMQKSTILYQVPIKKTSAIQIPSFFAWCHE